MLLLPGVSELQPCLALGALGRGQTDSRWPHSTAASVVACLEGHREKCVFIRVAGISEVDCQGLATQDSRQWDPAPCNTSLHLSSLFLLASASWSMSVG